MKCFIPIYFFAVIIPTQLKATGQASELIIFEGDTLEMLTEPLESFLREHEPRNQYYPFLENGCSTALWRGYIGLWKLENNELILIDVFACGDRDESIREKIFPNKERIVADWFSGELSIQHGEVIKYNHSAYDRYYEEETVVTLESGFKTNQGHYVNGSRVDDLGFSNNPDSIIAEIYRRINWDQLDNLKKEQRLFVELKMGKIDSLIIRGNSEGLYRQELQKTLDEFPQLKKFYWRNEPLETGYIFPIVLNKASRRKYAR